MATAASVRSPDRVVYVVQEDTKKNITPALEFGSVETLLDRDDELVFMNTSRIVKKLKHGLRNYRKSDLILPIGNPVSIGIAFAIAADLTGGEFGVLRWDQQERQYYELHVNMRDGEV